MAKYSLPEMFGQLPDIVMQGFSDPEIASFNSLRFDGALAFALPLGI